MNNLDLSTLSRRRFIGITGSAAVAVAFAPRVLFAESKGIVPTMIDEAAKARINTYPLRRNISVLEGSGGNIGVLTGKDGKLLVDSGFTVSKQRILEALSSLGSDPITRLLNTHWHTDHTDGNAWVHAAGAEITAHVNTKKYLSTSTQVEGWNWTFPPAPAGAIRGTVFNDEHRLHHSDTTLRCDSEGSQLRKRGFAPRHQDQHRRHGENNATSPGSLCEDLRILAVPHTVGRRLTSGTATTNTKILALPSCNCPEATFLV